MMNFLHSLMYVVVFESNGVEASSFGFLEASMLVDITSMLPHTTVTEIG